MILGLWLILYASFTLFMPPLLDDADSVHAEAAREMLLRHDYVTLTTNGVRYLEKAPLLYWLMAGFLRLMGGPRHPHVWAARLPLALTMLALAYVLRRLGREMFGSDRAGFYAAVIALTSFGVFIFTRILIPDALLTLWIAAGLLFFWRTLRSEAEGDAPKMLDCMGIGACCALAVLSKGLIGILFPVAVIFLFLGCTKNLWHLARFNPVTSLVTFLLIAAPWHWMAALRSPAQGNPLGFTPTPGNVHGFAWFYFVNDQFARYVGRRVPHDYDTVPLVLFWGLVLVWLMPWSAFLFKALRRVPLWAGVRRLDLSEAEQPWFFCGLWALVVMVFFSFSTRQEYYVLPAVPALALLLGAWLAAEHHASIGDDATPAAGRKSRAACCGRRQAGVVASARGQADFGGTAGGRRAARYCGALLRDALSAARSGWTGRDARTLAAGIRAEFRTLSGSAAGGDGSISLAADGCRPGAADGRVRQLFLPAARQARDSEHVPDGHGGGDSGRFALRAGHLLADPQLGYAGTGDFAGG